jgi:creatinine amidohydrolase/Fe(II)-dependent formamide hydrolase-like protein
MKAPTVFLGELTNSELESWLSSTVIIPGGAVEQHGPHSAMLTDVIIPNEIARRGKVIYERAGCHPIASDPILLTPVKISGKSNYDFVAENKWFPQQRCSVG